VRSASVSSADILSAALIRDHVSKQLLRSTCFKYSKPLEIRLELLFRPVRPKRPRDCSNAVKKKGLHFCNPLILLPGRLGLFAPSLGLTLPR
jgi:hypothetical protein